MEKVYKSKRKTWARVREIAKDIWNGEEALVSILGYSGTMWLILGLLFSHTILGTVSLSLGGILLVRDLYVKVKPLFKTKK